MPPPKDHPLPNPVEGPGDYTITETVHSDTYPAISPVTSNPSNKTVFITGASKGIGRAITISFARAGASRIAIGARSDLSDVVKDIQIAALEAERKTPQILAVSLDVSDVKSVASAAKEVETVFGELDIVISNAGILVAATIADSNPEDWWNSWAVNLYGSYLIAKGFMPLLLKKKDGDKTFITISSVGAHLTILGLSAYQTSKLAQLRLMEFICAEYANQDVLAYSIHPGNIPGTDIMGPAGVPNHLKHAFVDTLELCGDTLTFLTREKRMWLAGRYINCTWDMPQLMAQEEKIVEEDKLKVKLVV